MSDIELKVILFDLDGVIIDSEPIYDQMFKHHLRDHDISNEDYDDIIGGSWELAFEYVNDKFGIKLDPQKESEKISDTIVDYIEDVGMPLKENARQAIEQLSEQYQLLVVSSSHRKVIERALRHHGLFNYFKEIIAVEDIQYPKPHPEPYLLGMKKAKAQPEETIVIEDSLNGAKAGAAAGAFVYAMPDPRVPEEKYIQYAKVVHSFEDIMKDLL